MPGLKNTLARLTIESLSSDGSGVGRLDGKAVFVPATAPGDDATVKIVKDMGRYAFGIVEELHVPGPGHIQPDCPVPAAGAVSVIWTMRPKPAPKRALWSMRSAVSAALMLCRCCRCSPAP